MALKVEAVDRVRQMVDQAVEADNMDKAEQLQEQAEALEAVS